MANAVDDLIAAFDKATNDIAARIDRLLAQISGNTITDEQKAALSAEVTRLQTLGQDPQNPVPTP